MEGPLTLVYSEVGAAAGSHDLRPGVSIIADNTPEGLEDKRTLAIVRDGEEAEVFIPPMCSLLRRHVEVALDAVPDDVRSVTVRIHTSTISIADACFYERLRVSRILEWGSAREDSGATAPHSNAVLGACTS